MKFLPHVVSLDILSDKVPLGAVQLKGWHPARVLQQFPVIWEWLSLDCSTGQEPAQSRREWFRGKIFHGFCFVNGLIKNLLTICSLSSHEALPDSWS